MYFFPFFLWHFETGFHYLAQVSLELATFHPLPPECLDYGSVVPEPADFLHLKCSSVMFKSVICDLPFHLFAIPTCLQLFINM